MSDDHSPFPDPDEVADMADLGDVGDDGAPHDEIDLDDDHDHDQAHDADHDHDHDPLDLLHDDLDDLDDPDDPDHLDDQADTLDAADDDDDDGDTTDDQDEGDDEPDDASDPLDELRFDDATIESPYGDAVTDLLHSLDIDATTFERTMADLGLAEEADARSVVVTFEQLGVDAHVEHADVDRLAELLTGGAEVRLGGEQILTGLDDVTDEAIVTDGRDTWRVPLEELDTGWAAHTHEMIVTEAPGRMLVLLPVDGTNDGGNQG